MKKLILLMSTLFLFAQQKMVVVTSPIWVKPSVIKITGIGEGVIPPNAVSKAQAQALARRAAIVDAYRSLAEKMYGIRLSAKDKVKDLILQHTEIRSSVSGVIQGAIIDEESFKNGIYKVVLRVELDPCIWANYLHAPSLYQCNIKNK